MAAAPLGARPRGLKPEHTKRRLVTMEVWFEPGVSDADLRAYVRDLEWAGGCRHPDEDRLFSSVSLSKIRIMKA